MAFKLVTGLAAKDYLLDLKLCRVLFEDNCHYPWIFLVPMKEGVKNMTNLNMEERMQLMREIALAESVMFKLFPCDQDNVAMIGNLTPQLHVHVVCRKDGDPDWPDTVWNKTTGKYAPEEKTKIMQQIKQEFLAQMNDAQYKINQ